MNRTPPHPAHVSRRRSASCIATVGLVIAGAWPAQPASADEPATTMVPIEAGDGLAKAAFPLNDDDPESSVPTAEQAMRRPLQMGYFVMLLLERGKKAMDRGDHTAAVKYHRAVVKAMPERSTSYALLCESYEKAGDLPSAIEACRTTLGKAGVTVADNMRFVELLVKQDAALQPKEIEDVRAVIAHLEKELAQDESMPVVVNRLKCGVATKLEDTTGLEACSAKLLELAPKEPHTVAFAWALLLKRRDFKGAEAYFKQVERYGLPEEALEKMQSSLRSARDSGNVWRDWLGLAVSIAAALLAAVLAAVALHRRKRPLLSAELPQNAAR